MVDIEAGGPIDTITATEVTWKDGSIALRSYGSMSYAGLLSFIYAEMKENDPRLVAVRDWLRAHYTIKENPGMGEQGLYYYYHTMAKALSLSGIKKIKDGEGKMRDWRKELALELLNQQDPKGFRTPTCKLHEGRRFSGYTTYLLAMATS